MERPTQLGYEHVGQDDWIIANTYKILTRNKLGAGAFGDIYKGIVLTTGEEVACKIEKARTRQVQLAAETRLYRILQGGVGIPTVHWFGSDGEYNIMIMDLLGSSLEDVFTKCGRKFSLKTILMLAEQLLTRIEYLHSKSFIHRDIKPDNFLIGRGRKESTVYMIDLGLAKRFRDPRTHQHIPYRETKGIVGTMRYASVNTHIGIEQSRRDDLESIAYMFVYFLNGNLPWQGIKAKGRHNRYCKIGDMKMSIPTETLCKGLPTEFRTFLDYVRSLRFEGKPDYKYLRKLFSDLFVREQYQFDSIYDWNNVRTRQSMMQSNAKEREKARAVRMKTGEDEEKSEKRKKVVKLHIVTDEGEKDNQREKLLRYHSPRKKVRQRAKEGFRGSSLSEQDEEKEYSSSESKPNTHNSFSYSPSHLSRRSHSHSRLHSHSRSNNSSSFHSRSVSLSHILPLPSPSPSPSYPSYSPSRSPYPSPSLSPLASPLPSPFPSSSFSVSFSNSHNYESRHKSSSKPKDSPTNRKERRVKITAGSSAKEEGEEEREEREDERMKKGSERAAQQKLLETAQQLQKRQPLKLTLSDIEEAEEEMERRRKKARREARMEALLHEEEQRRHTLEEKRERRRKEMLGAELYNLDRHTPHTILLQPTDKSRRDSEKEKKERERERERIRMKLREREKMKEQLRKDREKEREREREREKEREREREKEREYQREAERTNRKKYDANNDYGRNEEHRHQMEGHRTEHKQHRAYEDDEEEEEEEEEEVDVNVGENQRNGKPLTPTAAAASAYKRDMQLIQHRRSSSSPSQPPSSSPLVSHSSTYLFRTSSSSSSSSSSSTDKSRVSTHSTSSPSSATSPTQPRHTSLSQHDLISPNQHITRSPLLLPSSTQTQHTSPPYTSSKSPMFASKLLPLPSVDFGSKANTSASSSSSSSSSLPPSDNPSFLPQSPIETAEPSSLSADQAAYNVEVALRIWGDAAFDSSAAAASSLTRNDDNTQNASKTKNASKTVMPSSAEDVVCTKVSLAPHPLAPQDQQNAVYRMNAASSDVIPSSSSSSSSSSSPLPSPVLVPSPSPTSSPLPSSSSSSASPSPSLQPFLSPASSMPSSLSHFDSSSKTSSSSSSSSFALPPSISPPRVIHQSSHVASMPLQRIDLPSNSSSRHTPSTRTDSRGSAEGEMSTLIDAIRCITETPADKTAPSSAGQHFTYASVGTRRITQPIPIKYFESHLPQASSAVVPGLCDSSCLSASKSGNVAASMPSFLSPHPLSFSSTTQISPQMQITVPSDVKVGILTQIQEAASTLQPSFTSSSSSSSLSSTSTSSSASSSSSSASSSSAPLFSMAPKLSLGSSSSASSSKQNKLRRSSADLPAPLPQPSLIPSSSTSSVHSSDALLPDANAASSLTAPNSPGAVTPNTSIASLLSSAIDTVLIEPTASGASLSSKGPKKKLFLPRLFHSDSFRSDISLTRSTNNSSLLAGEGSSERAEKGAVASQVASGCPNGTLSDSRFASHTSSASSIAPLILVGPRSRRDSDASMLSRGGGGSGTLRGALPLPRLVSQIAASELGIAATPTRQTGLSCVWKNEEETEEAERDKKEEDKWVNKIELDGQTKSENQKIETAAIGGEGDASMSHEEHFSSEQVEKTTKNLTDSIVPQHTSKFKKPTIPINISALVIPPFKGRTQPDDSSQLLDTLSSSSTASASSSSSASSLPHRHSHRSMHHSPSALSTSSSSSDLAQLSQQPQPPNLQQHVTFQTPLTPPSPHPPSLFSSASSLLSSKLVNSPVPSSPLSTSYASTSRFAVSRRVPDQRIYVPSPLQPRSGPNSPSTIHPPTIRSNRLSFTPFNPNKLSVIESSSQSTSATLLSGTHEAAEETEATETAEQDALSREEKEHKHQRDHSLNQNEESEDDSNFGLSSGCSAEEETQSASELMPESQCEGNSEDEEEGEQEREQEQEQEGIDEDFSEIDDDRSSKDEHVQHSCCSGNNRNVGEQDIIETGCVNSTLRDIELEKKCCHYNNDNLHSNERERGNVDSVEDGHDAFEEELQAKLPTSCNEHCTLVPHSSITL